MADDPAFDHLNAYVEDLHAGKSPDRGKLLAEHPELAALLACLDSLARMAPRTGGPAQANGSRGDSLKTEPSAVPMATPVSFEEMANGFEKFELLHEIGRGGMGVIWKARQKGLDRLVAIKMILASHLASDTQVDRFTAEAKTMARLHHPNIVGIHETGEVNGQHYFVMEYIAGRSLAEANRSRRLEPEQAARQAATVAQAVAYLHSQGVVHRDLKPSNILLDEAGQPYVTDFGLVKMLDSSSHMTSTGVIVGTPAYMAPEQAAGRASQVGPLSDVYGLGAILYELLTGRPPFHEDNPLDTLVQVIESEPTRPRLLNPRIPRNLEMICLRCLEKAPEERYPSAQALADDLERYLNGEPVEARPPGIWQKTRRWSRREPALASHLGALAVCMGIIQVHFFVDPAARLALHLEVVALVALWMLSSLMCQQALRREGYTGWVQFIWSALDCLLLTGLLILTGNQTSPLIVGYPLLVAASGLWFRVRLVWFTTAMAELAYVILITDSVIATTNSMPGLHHCVIFMVAVAVMGFVVAYQVHRVKVLNRYYERRRLPGTTSEKPKEAHPVGPR